MNITGFSLAARVMGVTLGMLFGSLVVAELYLILISIA